MKTSGHSRRNRIIGICLLAAALISCAGGLTSVRSGIRNSYPATGRSGDFSPPSRPEGTVSINFGTEEELIELPGIGEHMAGLILEERKINGLFFYPEDLLAVKGIGPSKLAKIRPLLDMETR